MDDDLLRYSRSFDKVAGSYDRGRPSYPTAAAEWLIGPEQKTVLEVGAGTGKLTEQLVALGHDVHATDPSSVLLGVLPRSSRCPTARSTSSRVRRRSTGSTRRPRWRSSPACCGRVATSR